MVVGVGCPLVGDRLASMLSSWRRCALPLQVQQWRVRPGGTSWTTGVSGNRVDRYVHPGWSAVMLRSVGLRLCCVVLSVSNIELRLCCVVLSVSNIGTYRAYLLCPGREVRRSQAARDRLAFVRVGRQFL